MTRLFDRLLEWLMRPGVRRVRRWSFAITIPIALLVVHFIGVQQGALVLAIRFALWVAVAVVAWRAGGARGEALRDLLMHPRGRALTRAELDTLTALPRLLVVRAGGVVRAGTTYHHGTFGFALGMAFTPVVLSEAAAVHLLLHGSWVAWVLGALHAYGLVWLWGFAIGPRAFPHRIGAQTAVLRNGPMYRAKVPLAAIAAVTARTERVGDERGLVQRDETVLLAARGRVDVWLELTEPVLVQRPLAEPLSTHRLAIASDEPDQLVASLLAGAAQRATGRADTRHAALGLGSALDFAGQVRDATQPA